MNSRYITSYVQARNSFDNAQEAAGTHEKFHSFEFIDNYLARVDINLQPFVNTAAIIKNQVREEFEKYISLAEQKEKELCSALGVENVEELQKNIIKTNESCEAIASLSGVEMSKVWALDLLPVSQGVFIANLQKKWEEYKGTPPGQQALGESMVNFFQERVALPRGKSDSRYKFGRVDKIKDGWETPSGQLVIKNFTKTMLYRLDEFLDKALTGKESHAPARNKTDEKSGQVILGIAGKSKPKVDEAPITDGGFETFVTIVLEEKNKGTVDLPALKEKLKNYILNKVSGADDQLLKKCIDHILDNKDKDTYVLGLTKPELVEGFLGELQALYYFCSILKQDPGGQVRWIGGINNPHADLLIKDKAAEKNFGVQIKNTKADVFAEGSRQISFRALNFENFFTLYKESAFGQVYGEARNQLIDWEDVVTMMAEIYEFHIPYVVKENEDKSLTYKKGPNPEFTSMRTAIEYLWAKVGSLFEMLAGAMMYLDLANESFTDIKDSKNVLYIIGGISCVGIVQILKEIQEEVLRCTNAWDHQFQITPYVERKERYDITSYLNERAKAKKEGTGAPTAIGEEISDEVRRMLSKIKLQSSYTFKTIKN